LRFPADQAPNIRVATFSSPTRRSVGLGPMNQASRARYDASRTPTSARDWPAKPVHGKSKKLDALVDEFGSRQAAQSLEVVCDGANTPTSASSLAATRAPVAGRPVSALAVARTRHSLEPVEQGSPRGFLVTPPWSPERANMDRPPYKTIQQRKQDYKIMLDNQTAERADQLRQRTEEEMRLDKTTPNSWESKYHTWGSEAFDAAGCRAVAQELRATVIYNQRQEQMLKENERQESARWAEESGRAMAWQCHIKRQQAKQVQRRQAAVWTAAVLDRKRREEAERADALRDERVMLERLVKGTRSPWRQRRQRDASIASRDQPLRVA